jgi:hypothetical protein
MVIPFPEVTEELRSLRDLSGQWAIVARQPFGEWRRPRGFHRHEYSARGPRLHWVWTLGPLDQAMFKSFQARGLVATVQRREDTMLVLYARIPQLRVATERAATLEFRRYPGDRLRYSARIGA